MECKTRYISIPGISRNFPQSLSTHHRDYHRIETGVFVGSTYFTGPSSTCNSGDNVQKIGCYLVKMEAWVIVELGPWNLSSIHHLIGREILVITWSCFVKCSSWRNTVCIARSYFSKGELSGFCPLPDLEPKS